MRFLIPLLLLLSHACMPPSASAQQVTSVVLRWDNDILAIRGAGAPPDYDYTQGLHLGARLDGVPRPLRRLLGTGAGAGRSHVGIGQRIYTPRQDGAEPVPGERPYAGWLYLDAAVVIATGSAVEHHLAVEVGVTGPAALGEPVQNGFHRLVGSTPQQGWEHQLRTEVAGTARYAMAGTHQWGGARLRPRVEVAIGTLWSGAAGGLDVRFGAAPGARGLSARVGVRQEWVARSLFLDGNTFGTGLRADRRSWVGEAAAGVGYQLERWGVDYRFVLRSREYAAQPGAHGYGSITLGWRR